MHGRKFHCLVMTSENETPQNIELLYFCDFSDGLKFQPPPPPPSLNNGPDPTLPPPTVTSGTTQSTTTRRVTTGTTGTLKSITAEVSRQQ